MTINYPIRYIDRDDVIAANGVEAIDEIDEIDEIELLRREVIRLTTEIDQKQPELFAIQSSLAGTIQA